MSDNQIETFISELVDTPETLMIMIVHEDLSVHCFEADDMRRGTVCATMKSAINKKVKGYLSELETTIIE